MPRTPEQNESIRKERQTAILKAALAVYVDKGYAAAEIGDVAKQAGLARGLVYYYFKDKAELFRRLFEYMIEQSRSHLDAYFDSEAPALALLERYASDMLENVLQNPEHVLFFMRMRHDLPMLFKPEEQQTLKWPAEFMDRLKRMMQRGMDEGAIRPMNPALLSRQFWASIMLALVYMIETIREEGKSEALLAQLRRDGRDAALGSIALLRKAAADDASAPDITQERSE